MTAAARCCSEVSLSVSISTESSPEGTGAGSQIFCGGSKLWEAAGWEGAFAISSRSATYCTAERCQSSESRCAATIGAAKCCESSPVVLGGLVMTAPGLTCREEVAALREIGEEERELLGPCGGDVVTGAAELSLSNPSSKPSRWRRLAMPSRSAWLPANPQCQKLFSVKISLNHCEMEK